MPDYGILSVLPPVIAIILAIRTRQVYLALLFGIWMGWTVMSSWNPVAGAMATLQALVDVFKDEGQTRTIMFSALVGALIIFIQRSGGVRGFIMWLEKAIDKYAARNNERMVQILAAITGILIFVESSISVLTVGTLYRPVFDKLRISREKLAYIADSSSAPVCILLPFNAWGAFIMGQLLILGIDRPFSVLMRAQLYNFYPILALVLVFIIIFRGRDFGKMKKAEYRTKELGQVLNPGSIPMVSDEITEVEPVSGVRPKAFNMTLPIAVMVLMMPLMLTLTGWGSAITDIPQESFFRKVTYAMGAGSGSTSVLVAVVTSIIFATILYAFQRMFKLAEVVNLTMKGISGMMPLALLMLMAFAISAVCRELGTGAFISEVTSSWLSPSLLPVIVFLTSCFIAFSTGTSWGTFGIMLAIAVPMAQVMEGDMLLVIAAVMSGGVFGDHCSPISDTTIIASMAAATDHIDHVNTQIPYALVAGSIAALCFLVAGFIS